MKVVVIGSGGREHSIVWKLSLDNRVKNIYTFTDNSGIVALSNFSEPLNNLETIIDKVLEINPDMVVVGPEEPLSKGITNILNEKNIKVFGPSKEAARIESSKIFSKKLMLDNNIPTAYAEFFSDFDKAKEYSEKKGFQNIVIKADGLAAGKGVFLPDSNDEMIEILNDLLRKNKLGESGKSILIEDRIFGKEVSVFCFTDGKNYSKPVAICDYKRVFDDDLGSNTGGMGCYSPPEFWSKDLEKNILEKIVDPTIKSMNDIKSSFKGILYTGIMITESGPKVIEYNCRFGDPETQPILLRLKSSLVELCLAAINDELESHEIEWTEKHSCGVVIASQGYPESYESNKLVSLPNNTESETKLFHAGTKLSNNEVLTSGGRVFCATALGDNLKEAQAKAYNLVDKVSFEGAFFRKDIGFKGIK